MKVPLYILGFLLRFGPQHGYRLKQCLEDASDFAQIKLPTVYYHLEKMKKKGLVKASQEKEGKRPEKWVYAITDAGKIAFRQMLEDALKSQFQTEFLFDAALYFGDVLEPQHIINAINRRIHNVELILKHLATHQLDVLSQISEQPETTKILEKSLFRHHQYHYQAELTWLKETLKNLEAFTQESGNETSE